MEDVNMKEIMPRLSSCYIPASTDNKILSQFSELLMRIFRRDLEKDNKKTSVYRPDHFISFIVVYDEKKKRKCIFGPILSMHMSDYRKSGFAEFYNIRYSQREDFYEYLSALPVLNPLESISLATYIHDSVCHESISSEEVCVFPDKWNHKTKKTLKPYLEWEHPLEKSENHIWKNQMDVFRMIREGRPDKLVQEERSQKVTYHLGMVNDTLDNYKITAYMSLSLSMNAAIEGGEAYSNALSVFDMFSYEINSARNIHQVMNLIAEAHLEYAYRVERIRKTREYPIQLKKVIDFVDLHINEPLTVGRISNDTNTSETYVSKLFQKYLKVSTGEYVRMKKVEEAKQLLRETDLSISSISEQLGFSSQSQFQKVFRRCTHITPGQYRKGAIKENNNSFM